MNSAIRILFICQVIYWSTVIIGVSLSSIVGTQLSSHSELVTLPLALLAVGNIVSTLPLSLIMQRYGRRFGFCLGAIASIIGGIVCSIGVYKALFWVFCLGNFILGFAQASALYYRLAATDSVEPQKQGRAIAWVMSGGIIAAIIAPTLAIESKDFFLPHLFLGSYCLVALLSVFTFVLCLQLPDDKIEKQKSNQGRKLLTIIKQPIFIAAISNTAISHATMVFIMIATPIAIISCGYSLHHASYAIQWHVLGMFIPSFFAGRLIDRFGSASIGLFGTGLLTISIIISLLGTALANFYSSLFLLGLGWNLMYTAGSTMLTLSHTSEEKGMVQGIAEFFVACLASLAAFGSGALLHAFGWFDVNMGSIPLLVSAAIITLWFNYFGNKQSTVFN